MRIFVQFRLIKIGVTLGEQLRSCVMRRLHSCWCAFSFRNAISHTECRMLYFLES